MEWHQSAWQWLNHLEEIRKGVACEHREKSARDVDSVGVVDHVSAKGDRMDLDLRDKLGKYRAMERHYQLDADLKLAAAANAERRYYRCADLVRSLEKELKEARYD